MKRLSLLALLTMLALPAGAAAAGSVSGATHAVIRAVAEEGGTVVYYGTPQVHCRPTAPSHFGCSFFNVTRGLGGRVTVTYSHRRYYVGEPSYESHGNMGWCRPPDHEAFSACSAAMRTGCELLASIYREFDPSEGGSVELSL